MSGKFGKQTHVSEPGGEARLIHYEGDDVAGFIATCRADYGFDPETEGEGSYIFLCPPALEQPLMARFPMGT